MAVFLSELWSAGISQRAGWQLERMMGYEMEILDKGHYTTADFRASTDGRTYLITITHCATTKAPASRSSTSGLTDNAPSACKYTRTSPPAGMLMGKDPVPS